MTDTVIVKQFKCSRCKCRVAPDHVASTANRCQYGTGCGLTRIPEKVLKKQITMLEDHNMERVVKQTARLLLVAPKKTEPAPDEMEIKVSRPFVMRIKANGEIKYKSFG